MIGSRLPLFAETLERHGLGLARGGLATLQVNTGKLCNQACLHCHVDAGPKRTEVMTLETVERVLALLEATPTVRTVDITGGAPELHPHFRRLVSGARTMGREVVDRCNLTVLLEPGQEGTAEYLARQRVRIIASLPCYTAENVERQRGGGVYQKSITALQRLNALGYGLEGSGLVLDLVYNPLGPSLPASQSALESDYRRELHATHRIEFSHLLTLTNMPISRFRHDLERSGRLEGYLELLHERFNPDAVPGLMCRTLVSVGWDGFLYDCDFNQMLELGLAGRRLSIWDIGSLAELEQLPIATAAHCYGCTAGQGSSCGGAIA